MEICHFDGQAINNYRCIILLACMHACMILLLLLHGICHCKGFPSLPFLPVPTFLSCRVTLSFPGCWDFACSTGVVMMFASLHFTTGTGVWYSWLDITHRRTTPSLTSDSSVLFFFFFSPYSNFKTSRHRRIPRLSF